MANTRVQRLAATGAPSNWHADTTSLLTQAHKVQAAADANATKSLVSHENSRYEHDTQNYTVHRRLVVKVGQTRRLAERLQERITSMDGATNLTRTSLDDLKQAFEAKKVPLQLNSWRQRRRAERPHRELVKDSLEGALLEEQQTLLNAQKLLQRGIRKTEAMILSLEQVLTSLQEDHQMKREAWRIDRQCIETSSSWNGCNLHQGDDPTASAAQSRPQTSGATTDGGRTTGMSTRGSHSLASGYSTPFEEAENQRQFNTIQLTNQAKRREAQAVELRSEMAELIRHTQVQCTTALKGVEQRLNERFEETRVISQRIEKAIEITDAKIDKTKRCLARTSAEIKSFEQPIDVAGVRQRLRESLPRPERVNDEVSDALNTQFTRLRKNMETLETRHKEEKEGFLRLEEAKAKLTADLQDKMTALRIERSIMPNTKGVIARGVGRAMPPISPGPGQAPRSPVSARSPVSVRSPRRTPSRMHAPIKMPLTAR